MAHDFFIGTDLCAKTIFDNEKTLENQGFLELLAGFEPATSSLPRTRSTNWAIAAYISLWHYSEFLCKCQAKITLFLKKLKKKSSALCGGFPHVFVLHFILHILRRGIREWRWPWFDRDIQVPFQFSLQYPSPRTALVRHPLVQVWQWHVLHGQLE